MSTIPVNEVQFVNNLMIVMTLFQQKLEQSEAFRSLTNALYRHPSTASLFVYDNSPEPQPISNNPHWQIHYVHDPKNPGVSKAYNQGYTQAIDQKKQWLLLTDQDTAFPPETFNKYFESLGQHASGVYVPSLTDAFGILSPHTFQWGAGQRVQTLEMGKPLNLTTYFFINSGLLIDIETFGKTRYDENLPLDFSDFAFVHRLRKNHSSFYLVNLSCRHHLSANEKTDLSKKLQRFRDYLSASNYYKANYTPYDSMITLRNFLRAAKLSLQYRSVQFLVYYFRSL